MALVDYAAPIAALVTALLVVWGLYTLFTRQQSDLEQRVKQYGAKPKAVRAAVRKGSLFKDRSASSVEVIDRLLTGRSYTENVALELSRAAVPLRVAEYLLIRWGISATLLILGVLADLALPVAALFALLGFFIPKLYVSRKEKARIKKIEDQLVDALTMMANALKSGSSFLQAMELVSRELPEPISQEFGQVVAEAGVGAPLDQSLADMAKRVRSYDVYLMVTAMTIQRSVGGNLAEVLDKIAHTIRERQRLLRQVQVETAEQRFSAYILLALPTVMAIIIAIINPPYIAPLITETFGRILLGVSIVLQIFGYLIMRKIADVRV